MRKTLRAGALGAALAMAATMAPTVPTAEAQGLRCNGLAVTRAGTMGNDTIVGTPGRDVIHGLAGNDVISGLAGNDVICGGNGNDIIRGANGWDVLIGGNGNDSLIGGNGNDRMLAGAGNDILLGLGGDDILNGGPGSDNCDGGFGRDSGPGCEIRKALLRPVVLLQRNLNITSGRTVTYRFNVEAGDWITVNYANAQSGATGEVYNGTGSWELLDSAGRRVAGSYSRIADMTDPVRSAAGGTHRLVITADVGETVNVPVQVVRSPVTIARLARNTPSVANIGVPGETRRYRFQATRGERFYLDFDNDAAYSSTNVWVVPVGKSLDDAIDERTFIREDGQTIIPATGAYDLVFRGDRDNLGRVDFTMWTTSRTVRNVNFGANINAAFTKPGEIDVYRLQASAGDRLNLTVTPEIDGDGIRNFGRYTIERVGGFGDQEIADESFCCEEEVVLPATGTYLVSLQGWGDRTHAYNVNFARG